MEEKIIEWARERGISNPENYPKQSMKLIEEAGELFGAILKGKREEENDAFGDIQVVLIILAEQRGVDLKGALGDAYEVIKDRKGETVNGTFIKNE